MARRRRALAPALVVGILLVLVAHAYASELHFTRLTGFAAIGRRFGQHIGLQRQAISEIGNDGQFAYYLALDPRFVVSCAHDAVTCPLDTPALRSERILSPLTARLLAFGQPGLVPFTLLLTNFVAILVTVVLVGQLCVEAGASRWLGAAAGLFCGEVLAFLSDMTDPYALMWVVLAVWLLRKQRPLWASVAVMAALLTREPLIFFLPLLALPLVAERRWRVLGQCALIAGVPFLGWQVVLRVLYGKWALTDSSSAAPLVPVPFAGLWQDRSLSEFGPILVLVVVPMVAAAALALLALRRQGLRSLLADPVPLVVITYCLMMSLTSGYQWHDLWVAARLMSPGVVLGLLVACQAPRPLRASYAALVASFGTVAAVVTLAQVM